MDPLTGGDDSASRAASPQGAKETSVSEAAQLQSKPAAPHRRAADAAARWAVSLRDALRIIVTAVLLAFVFRAFFVEPFIIPTGSMAPTLLGEHWTILCPYCGTEFDVNRTEELDERPPPRAGCPNCRNWTQDPTFTARRGDRILVNKWIYDITSPNRWDVAVFRDPANPLTNYIKRVVGLPGESVLIRDGDVYIDGRIARKPQGVQRALWQPVYEQDWTPRPEEDRVLRWIAQPPDEGSGGWSGLDTRRIEGRAPDANPVVLEFDVDSAEYGFDFSAYNGGSAGNSVQDLRVVSDLLFKGRSATCDMELTSIGRRAALRLQSDGVAEVSLWKSTAAGEERIIQTPLRFDLRGALVSQAGLSQADRLFRVTAGGRTLWKQEIPAEADLAAEASAPFGPARFRFVLKHGAVELRHVRVDRDVFYTESRRSVRAVRGNAFQLGTGEYFVLGDNSADSHDAREWDLRSPLMPEGYQLGTVVRGQIVGGGAFVYLPGVWDRGLLGYWPWPDIGRVRFVR